METYLFKFSACLVIFWLVYILFLERQNMHHFKRFYLIGAAVLALVIPVLTITHYIEPIVTDFEMSPMFFPIEPSFVELPKEQPPFIDIETAISILYGLGVLLFTIRFVVNLFKMYKRISGNETLTKRSFIYVLLEECRIPHSFFKYIFFSKSKYKTDSIPKEVLLHEETHAKQLHSIDIIIIELLQIVFWFHPLVYILKHHIKLNHEFLADQAVLEQGSDPKTYQNILLQFSSTTQDYQLSSAINYSSIKKRFTVMKTQTSKTRIWLSSLLLLPIIAILFYSFAEKEYVEKEQIDPVASILEELQEANKLNMTYVNGATPAMMKEYNHWIKKLNNDSSSLFIPVGTWERLVAIYDLMSEEQRNSVEKHPFLQEMIPDLYSVKPSKPTSSQFESWKNEKEYAIWIDNKHVSNSELNNYKVSDIAHFAGSSIHSNAKSKKFPQPFQFRLYTKDGFDKFYKQVYVSDYRALTETYSNAINTYLKGSQTDNSELRILKAQADKFYNQFTKEEIEKHKILPVPPVPARKNSKNKDELTEFLKKEINQENLKTITVLINRNDQFLINDELGNYKSLEVLIKKLPKPELYTADFKADKEASKELIHKTLGLLLNNRINVPYKEGSQFQEYEYNPSFLDYIIEMEKEGAIFYLNGKEIAAKKAKSIAENGERTEMITQKDVNGSYIVKLSSVTKNNLSARSIDLKILNDGSYLIHGKKATKRTFVDVFNQLHQDITTETRNKIINIHVSSTQEISNKETWFIYNSLKDYGFYRIVTSNQEINRAKGNTPFAIENSFSKQQKATVKQIADYNAWAKKMTKAIKKAEASKNKKLYPKITKEEYKKYYEIYSALMSKEQRENAEAWPNIPPPPPPAPTKQEKATAKQVSEYNAWAKQLNASDNKIIKRKDLKKYKYIYNIMTAEQKKSSEAFPKLPPPPPPPPAPEPKVNKRVEKLPPPPPPPTTIKKAQYKRDKRKTLNEIIKETPKGIESGYELLENGESHYFTVYKGKKTYYNKDGFITNEKGKILPPPPPSAPKPKIDKDNEELPPPPPPPAPDSTLDFVIRMAKANAKFINSSKVITSDKAIALVKNNPKLNVKAEKTDTKQPVVYFFEKPRTIEVNGKVGEPLSIKVMVNGKKIDSPKLSMTKTEVKTIKLTTENGNVTEFKFKIPGKATELIKGNSIDTNENILKNIENVKKNIQLVLFAIKDGTESEIKPLVITITD